MSEPGKDDERLDDAIALRAEEANDSPDWEDDAAFWDRRYADEDYS